MKFSLSSCLEAGMKATTISSEELQTEEDGKVISTEEVQRNGDNVDGIVVNKEKEYVDFINKDMFLRINDRTGHHSCFLDDSISCTDTIRPLVLLLNGMTEEETIDIDINSYGGSIISMGLICSAIMRCQGTVNTNLLGFGYSAGSMIWACGHKLSVSPNTHGMFHMAIVGMIGRADEKSVELRHSADITTKMLKYCLNRKIITQDEFNNITVDKKEDIYIPYKELLARIEVINQENTNFRSLV